MITDENVNPHKGLKNTENGNCIGKDVTDILISCSCSNHT